VSELNPDSATTDGKQSFLDKMLDYLSLSRREKKKLSRQNNRLEAFLRAIPIEYCGWDQEGVQAISPGFALLLGVDKIEKLQDIQNALTAGDAAAIEGLYDRLQQFGEHFDIGVHTMVGKKSLKVFGKRGVVGDVEQVFSVIWALDITDFAQAAMRSIEVIGKVEKRENELRSLLGALPFRCGCATPRWIFRGATVSMRRRWMIRRPLSSPTKKNCR
jgi:hypothetical protein